MVVASVVLGLVATAILGTGCGAVATPSEEAARAVLEPALTQATPAGRTGLLLKGKAVWLQAPMFDKSCLEQNDLAFNDDPASRPSSGGGIPRISPTYKNQRYLLASTPTGYCVLLGDGLKAEIKDARYDWATKDRWHFTVAYTMANPTPWFGCLDPTVRERDIVVRQGEGEGAAPIIEGTLAIAEGDCPQPMPGGEERTARPRPSSAAPRPPSKADVEKLVKAFDDALWQGDFAAARDQLACYNLFEEDTFGSCSLAEVIALGPVPRGEPRMQDGTPWLEYLQDSPAAFGRISPDRKDKSLFHVEVTHKRTGKVRTFSVQWVGGAWKLVGVVGRQAESITTVRILTDLGDKDKRDIFERRLAGEPIDEQGNPLDPNAAPEEEQ